MKFVIPKYIAQDKMTLVIIGDRHFWVKNERKASKIRNLIDRYNADKDGSSEWYQVRMEIEKTLCGETDSLTWWE